MVRLLGFEPRLDSLSDCFLCRWDRGAYLYRALSSIIFRRCRSRTHVYRVGAGHNKPLYEPPILYQSIYNILRRISYIDTIYGGSGDDRILTCCFSDSRAAPCTPHSQMVDPMGFEPICLFSSLQERRPLLAVPGPIWCIRQGLNLRPSESQSDALPTELRMHGSPGETRTLGD